MRVINKYLVTLLTGAFLVPTFGQLSLPQWKKDFGKTVFPEQKGSKNLSIEDAFNFKNYPSSPIFTAYPSQKFLVFQYVRNKEKGNHLYRCNPEMGNIANSEKLFVHFDSVQTSLKKYDVTVGFLSFHFDTEESGWFSAGNRVFNFFIRQNGVFESYPMLTLGANRIAEEISTTDQACVYEKGKTTCRIAAFVEAHNIFISTFDTVRQITFDGKEGLVYGQSVHRNEFGINKGLFWSPRGEKLAFYRMDEQRVTSYPLNNISERPASSTSFKYPMAGDSSHSVSIGIFDPYTQKLIYLKTIGDYDSYLTNISWSENAKSIFVAHVTRNQKRMDLIEYSAETGDIIKIHFTETHAKYVEPEKGPLFIPGSTDFIWESERDGMNQLYYYRSNKVQKLNLPSEILEVTEILGFADKGKYLVGVGTFKTSLDRGIFQIELDKNNSVILGPKIGGSPSIVFHEDHPFIVVTFSDLNTNREIIAINRLQVPNKRIKPVAISQLYTNLNPASDFNIGRIELNSLEHPEDGVTLFTRTFYPPNFDSTKKYPVVVYVYGGPHAQMITNSWLGGGNLWMAYMATQGYIVFTLDNRGSAHRGLAFENAVHGKLGTFEMSDQLVGLNWLKSLTFIDSTRIGVHGWSFGGFMTTSLMTRYPGLYKVGVAGGPVIDWKYYEIMYTERYMDHPETNPQGYKENSLLQYAPQLKNRLLMIHGADDDVVVLQHSLLFLDTCVKSGNDQLDYFIYPGHKHNVIGKDRIHLYKKVSQYFFDHL